MNVKSLRNLRGYTMKELAIRSGLHQRVIEDIEARGDMANPKLSTLVKLADALGVSLDHLCHFGAYARKIPQNNSEVKPSIKDNRKQKYTNKVEGKGYDLLRHYDGVTKSGRRVKFMAASITDGRRIQETEAFVIGDDMNVYDFENRKIASVLFLATEL